MAEIYVDNTNGNDSTGDGSAGNPYKTIQKGFDVADPVGNTSTDTIWLGDTSPYVLSASVNWTAFGSTSLDYWLVVRGWDYSAGAGVAGVAEIDCNSAVTAAISTSSDSSYVEYFDLYIHDATSHILQPASNTEVRRCRFSGMASDKYAVFGDTRVRIEGCYADCGGVAANGFLLGNSGSAHRNIVLLGTASGAREGIQLNSDDALAENNVIVCRLRPRWRSD